MPTRLVAACCLLVMAAACGTTLDVPEVETQIAQQLEAEFSGSTWTVRCPDGIEPDAGATFSCTAVSDRDQPFDIQVTQDDADGSVIWRIVE